MTCAHNVSKNVFHCAKCHRTFGTIVLFDSHQTRQGREITCHKPRDLALDRYGTLRTKGDVLRIEASVGRMRAGRDHYAA